VQHEYYSLDASAEADESPSPSPFAFFGISSDVDPTKISALISSLAGKTPFYLHSFSNWTNEKTLETAVDLIKRCKEQKITPVISVQVSKVLGELEKTTLVSFVNKIVAEGVGDISIDFGKFDESMELKDLIEFQSETMKELAAKVPKLKNKFFVKLSKIENLFDSSLLDSMDEKEAMEYWNKLNERLHLNIIFLVPVSTVPSISTLKKYLPPIPQKRKLILQPSLEHPPNIQETNYERWIYGFLPVFSAFHPCLSRINFFCLEKFIRNPKKFVFFDTLKRALLTAVGDERAAEDIAHILDHSHPTTVISIRPLIEMKERLRRVQNHPSIPKDLRTELSPIFAKLSSFIEKSIDQYKKSKLKPQ
jgi:hypothetical protein